MKTSTEIAELAKALSRAQGQFTAAERAHTAKVQSKKGEGSSYQYSYADLQAYLDVVREPLAAAGLSFVQLPTVKGDEASVVTMLMHESGQFIESDPLSLTVDHDPDKRPTPQAIGSAITYARRYSLSAITGMASEADDDGAGASGLNAETGRREPKPACPKCGTNEHVIKGKEEFGGGWLCWKNKGGCGEKWQDAIEPTPEQRAKAKEIAEQHGMTTGDKLPPPGKPAIDTAREYLGKVDSMEKAVKMAEWTKARRIDKSLSAAEYHEIDSKLAAKAIEVCKAKADLEDCGKLLRAMHGELRISEGDFMQLATDLDAVEDAINAAADVEKARGRKREGAAA